MMTVTITPEKHSSAVTLRVKVNTGIGFNVEYQKMLPSTDMIGIFPFMWDEMGRAVEQRLRIMAGIAKEVRP